MSLTPSQIAKALMSEYDIHLVLDTSGSMVNAHKGGQSRWAAAQEIVSQFTAAALEIDADGINVITFGSKTKTYANANLDTVNEIFAAGPGGGTPLHEGLAQALAVAGSSPKKDAIIIFTDGEPDDAAAAKKVIINQANSQANDDDCTLLFVQLGDNSGATAYLKGLDNDLVTAGAKHDIVDVKTAAEVYAAPSIAELIQAALND